MERQKSSTERASPTGSAQCLAFSRRRSYIPAAVPVSIMSSDVFIQQTEKENEMLFDTIAEHGRGGLRLRLLCARTADILHPCIETDP